MKVDDVKLTAKNNYLIRRFASCLVSKVGQKTPAYIYAKIREISSLRKDTNQLSADIDSFLDPMWFNQIVETVKKKKI